MKSDCWALLCAALFATLLGTGFGAALPLAAQADDSLVVEPSPATLCVNGGTGEDDQSRMQRIEAALPRRCTSSDIRPSGRREVLACQKDRTESQQACQSKHLEPNREMKPR